MGWRRAALWANRDDLIADIESPTYERDMAADLATLRQAARVDEGMVSEGLDYFEKAGDAGDKLYVQAIRQKIAALEAILSAQPTPNSGYCPCMREDCPKCYTHPAAAVGVPPSVERQMERLRTTYPQAHIQEGAHGASLIVVPAVRLPVGYNLDTCTLLFTVRAPSGFVEAAPENFWVDSSQLALADGRKPAWSNTLNKIQGFPAWRDVTWFKWHLQAWSPYDCTLLNVVRAILLSLAAAPSTPDKETK